MSKRGNEPAFPVAWFTIITVAVALTVFGVSLLWYGTPCGIALCAIAAAITGFGYMVVRAHLAALEGGDDGE